MSRECVYLHLSGMFSFWQVIPETPINTLAWRGKYFQNIGIRVIQKPSNVFKINTVNTFIMFFGISKSQQKKPGPDSQISL